MVVHVAILCLSALLIQTITAQCLGNFNSGVGSGYLGGNSLLNNNGPGCNNQAIANGGCLQVTSYSPIAPTGLQVLADNLIIEGALQVGGSLPLLGTVALEGAVPTGGQAGASYGCGNGNVGIVGELGNGASVSSAGITGAGISGSGILGTGIPNGLGLGSAGIAAANLGLNGGLNGGLGCNRIL